jgi:hypothetical protein
MRNQVGLIILVGSGKQVPVPEELFQTLLTNVKQVPVHVTNITSQPSFA